MRKLIFKVVTAYLDELENKLNEVIKNYEWCELQALHKCLDFFMAVLLCELKNNEGESK